ncbi:MAG: glycine cleavage system aminomethyltransferase GcvT [Deltaproteobacteria bacterium]|nr:glycine cleavage system aminomethyltransferase GcvT [Deltaproteobacteria bacterium]
MTLKRTPLYESHVAAGAKMVDFGGFEMPLKYTGETAEHMAVRSGVGVFDVSHMGEAFIEGRGALAAMQRLLTNDAAKIKDGQAMYAGLLNEQGGFVDDVVAYRFSAERFLVCLNAGNQDKDFTWMRAVIAAQAFDCTVRNEGALWSQLAVQGPKAVDVVATLCGESVRSIEGYHFAEGSILGSPGIIARTGYTGEDGFELYVKNEQAPALWAAVVAAGAVPCGLACRDTLRLEAGMCLYGNDIDDDVTPLQANLGWIVKLEDRPAFIGMAALQAQKAAGLKRVLRGLVMIERGIARHGYDVVDDKGSKIGIVTSGTQAPFVNKPIAFAYVDKAHAEVGGTVSVLIRDKPVKATVTKLPFYKRSK